MSATSSQSALSGKCATFARSDFAGLPGAELQLFGQAGAESDACAVLTDSRQVKVADLPVVYLALSGERFDGHAFVRQCADDGARGAIISAAKKESVVVSLADLAPERNFFLVVVPESLLAYQQLATLYRQRVKPVVVAVTGSSGKTTTKEMCAAVFGASRRLHKSAANENNEIGVPKTLLSMPDDTQVVVVEMGMRGAGQIAELASCARPDIGIITGVGVAHIELLGSRENIARAKCELLPFINPDGGVAILGQAGGLLEEEAQRTRPQFKGRMLVFPQVDFKVQKADARTTTFTFGDEAAQKNHYTVQAHGTVLLQDAWCAVQAGLCAGLSADEVASGLAAWHAVEGRGNAVGTASGALLIDEAYNSNPDSVRCAVEAIISKEAFPQARKIVVLGEMLELGDFSDQLHRELGEWLKGQPITDLVTVGPQAALIADGAAGAAYSILSLPDRETASTRLRAMMGAGSLVMVKGSHGTKLYELVKELL